MKTPAYITLKAFHSQLGDIRNELDDFFDTQQGILWKSVGGCVLGGLTCCMSALYCAVEDAERHYNKWEKDKE